MVFDSNSNNTKRAQSSSEMDESMDGLSIDEKSIKDTEKSENKLSYHVFNSIVKKESIMAHQPKPNDKLLPKIDNISPILSKKHSVIGPEKEE